MKPSKPVLCRRSFGNLVARLLKQKTFVFQKLHCAAKPFMCCLPNGPQRFGDTPSEAIEAALKDAEGKV